MSWSVQVEHLSKMYKLGSAVDPAVDSLHKVFEKKVSQLLKRQSKIEETQSVPVNNNLVLSNSQREGCPPGYFWALKDVSFEIKQGERVGIIGKNGSGKSTLLKILSRITQPTEGQFKFRGRLISLLEVGTGFHADLSGRENIYLNAKINGMSNADIRKRFDKIVEFSELGAQIDTPIKRYSSGMYMRLAFSVAAHLESDILIVDEVLAVGDAGFQKKCLDKMLNVANQGRTLIFVSHDMEAVRNLCTTALLLDHGRVSHPQIPSTKALSGSPIDLIDQSHTETSIQETRSSLDVTKEYAMIGRSFQSEITWLNGNQPEFDQKVFLDGISILDKNGNKKNRFDVSEDLFVQIDFHVTEKKWPINVHIYVENLDGHRIFFSMDNLDVKEPIREPGYYRECCHIYSPLLNEGVYKIDIFICNGPQGNLYLSCDKICIEIVDGRLPAGIHGDWSREWFPSVIRPRLQWTEERVDP